MKLAFGFASGLAAALLLLAFAPRPLANKLSTLQDDGLRLAEVLERIDQDTNPIDIAFIGTSHTMDGIDDSDLQASLEKAGVRANVANLGVMWMGRDLHLWLTRRLLAHKTPKLIVLEINEHEPPYGHPLMPYVAAASDMLCCRFWDEFNFPKMFLLFLKEQFYGSISLAWTPFSRAAAAGAPQWEHGWHPLDGIWDARIPRALSLGDRIEGLMGSNSRSLAYELTSDFGRQAVRQIVEEARAAHVSIVFLYLPEFQYASRAEPENIRFYSELAPVIVPPEDLVANRLNWWDFAHLNRNGAQEFVPYLSAQLAAYWAKIPVREVGPLDLEGLPAEVRSH